MTREEIEKLEAGRELDALIAEIMEPKPLPISAKDLRKKEKMKEFYSVNCAWSEGAWWKAQIGTDHNIDEYGNYQADRDNDNVEWIPANAPSTDIADAWEVVEKFHIFEFCNITEHTDAPRRDGWVIQMFDKDRLTRYVTAPTAPLAICRAALMAVME